VLVRFDVVIAGSGPSGLAIAAACAEEGLGVLLLAGRKSTWQANYGAWVDSFTSLGLGDVFSMTWSRADVHLSSHNSCCLERPYGRVSNGRLRASLTARLEKAGAVWRAVDASSVCHDPQGSVVTDDEGGLWHARVVIDATGHRPALVDTAGEATLWQIAYGVEGNIRGHGLATDRMVFMDYRTTAHQGQGTPTFMYGMPMSEDRVFLEETQLVGTADMTMRELQRRLHGRLETRGWTFETQDEEECCVIPMNTPIPDMKQRVVAFGGAAGMVHPASGYLLARVFETAPRVANAIHAAIHSGRRAEDVCRAAWRQVWRRQDLLARVFYLYGAEIVSQMEHSDTEAHFAAFFSTPQKLWGAYLDGAGMGLVARTMMSHFLRCGPGLQWKLARSGHGIPPAFCRQMLA
jgi:lycopene beta-cyclase